MSDLTDSELADWLKEQVRGGCDLPLTAAFARKIAKRLQRTARLEAVALAAREWKKERGNLARSPGELMIFDALARLDAKDGREGE